MHTRVHTKKPAPEYIYFFFLILKYSRTAFSSAQHIPEEFFFITGFIIHVCPWFKREKIPVYLPNSFKCPHITARGYWHKSAVYYDVLFPWHWYFCACGKLELNGTNLTINISNKYFYCFENQVRKKSIHKNFIIYLTPDYSLIFQFII